MYTICSIITALFIAIIPINQATADDKTASAHAAQFQSALLSVMKDAKTLGVKGRYQKLKPIIEEAWHLSLMAGLSAGEYWKTSSNDQRKSLVQAFTRMSAATLATLFSGYSGEEFKIKGEREAQHGLVFVDTSLTVPGRDGDVPITYVAKRFEGQWRLIDAIVDSGISELKVRISEYRLVLKNGGVDALVRLLNTKADDLLS